MSPPHPSWQLLGRANFKSRAADQVDPVRARREWEDLAKAIERHGGTVVVLPPGDPALSGLTFAAEAGHPLPATRLGGKPRFLLANMKPEHRRQERDLWRPFLESMGFEVIPIEGGVWEGQGDVCRFDGATLLFWGGRTDLKGMHEAKRHFSGEVLELNVWEPAFHGNMAVLPLDEENAMLVCADVLHEDSLALLEARVGRDRMHFVTEEEMHAYATNGLPVGDTVICASIVPERVRQLLVREGLKVEVLSMTELCEKAGGAARCLVCRFDGAPDDLVIPESSRLEAWTS